MKRLVRFFMIVSACLGLATSFSMVNSQSAEASGGRGVICNWSSRTIWVTVEENANSRSSYWAAKSMNPGNCSSAINQDVEGLWGRQCDTRGNCSYQLWKLGDGFFWINDAFISPIPPGKWLRVNGAGVGAGWTDPNPSGPSWSDFRNTRPSLGNIQYTLTR